MPQIPYTPYSSVQPQVATPSVQVSTPGAAFGENIGAALRGLGATVEHSGDELFTRAMALQQLNNEAEARNAQIEFAKQTAPVVADFDSLKGKAARDALTPHLNRLSAMQEQMASTLSSPNARRMFRTDTSPFLQREIFSASRHAGDEFKNYIVGEAQARSDNVAHTWTDPENQSEVDEKVATHTEDIKTIAGVKGLGPESQADWVFKQTSNTLSQQINALALRGNTEKGFELLEKYKNEDKLTQENYEALQKNLWHRNRALGAEHLVAQVSKDGKLSPAQMQEKIEELAPKFDHGDPEFLDAAKHQLRMKLGWDDKIAKENQAQNMQTIYGLIRGGEVKDLTQLQAHATGGPAFDQLDEKSKLGMPKMIGDAILKRDFETSHRNYEILTDMFNDPTQRQKALSINLFDHDLKLSLPQVDHFLSLRNRLIKQPIDMPEVRQGWQAMRQQFGPQLQELGVVSNTGKEKPGSALSALRGGMSIAIQEFEQANKRPPSPEEFREKIAKPLIRTHAEPGFFGYLLGGKTVPEFARTFDKKELEDARKTLSEAAQKEGLNPPTDGDIHQWIIHKQWEEHFQGASSTPEGKPSGRSAVPVPD